MGIVKLWVKSGNYSIYGFVTMSESFHIIVIILSTNIKILISAAFTVHWNAMDTMHTLLCFMSYK